MSIIYIYTYAETRGFETQPLARGWSAKQPSLRCPTLLTRGELGFGVMSQSSLLKVCLHHFFAQVILGEYGVFEVYIGIIKKKKETTAF